MAFYQLNLRPSSLIVALFLLILHPLLMREVLAAALVRRVESRCLCLAAGAKI